MRNVIRENSFVCSVGIPFMPSSYVTVGLVAFVVIFAPRRFTCSVYSVVFFPVPGIFFIFLSVFNFEFLFVIVVKYLFGAGRAAR